MKQLKEIKDKTTFLEADSNGREIKIYKLSDVTVVKNTSFYPNTIFYSNQDKEFYNPMEEKVMSLASVDTNDNDLQIPSYDYNQINPVFFFNYNTDNYYHFVYDTLPYLITYKKLRAEIPHLKHLKLLMNYPNKEAKKHYKFVEEFLELLDIKKNDIILIHKNVCYSSVYISSSYTHGEDSNKPPREEIYKLYEELVQKARSIGTWSELPKKIYVSRRTWKHNDFSNIGTNYTTRRKLENEDTLVDILEKICGYTEIFTENLSTVEKILMFNEATHVVGAIGGGICNVLFSKPETKLIALISPGFLDVNQRFLFSLNKVDLKLFHETKHAEDTIFKKYMRVKTDEFVGEIIEIGSEDLLIQYTLDTVAGWNNQIKYETKWVTKYKCTPLDKGLNSSWKLDISKFLEII